jgi:hypothetical protein
MIPQGLCYCSNETLAVFRHCMLATEEETLRSVYTTILGEL